jgi:hypothetical protein
MLKERTHNDCIGGCKPKSVASPAAHEKQQVGKGADAHITWLVELAKKLP